MLIHLTDGSVYSAESFHAVYWLVTSPQDKTYAVDPVAGTCSCPAAKYREGPCKHVRMLREALLRGGAS